METLAPATPSLDRDALLDWYRRNRERSAFIFGLIAEGAFEDRPIPLRPPFIFYEGHLPAFSFLTLNGRALREEPPDPRLEKLFDRGTDPATIGSYHQRPPFKPVTLGELAALPITPAAVKAVVRI